MPLSFHPLSLLPLLFSSSSSVSRFFLVCARTETHSLNSPPPPSPRRRRTLCGIGTNKGGGGRGGREGQGRGPNKGGRARSIGKERAPFAPLGGPGPTSQRERERAGWAGEGIRQQVRRAGEGGGREKEKKLSSRLCLRKQAKRHFSSTLPFPSSVGETAFSSVRKGRRGVVRSSEGPLLGQPGGRGRKGGRVFPTVRP